MKISYHLRGKSLWIFFALAVQVGFTICQKNRKEILKERKCPNCKEQIKEYILSGVFIPFEGTAFQAIEECSNFKSKFPFLPFNYLSFSTWTRIISSCTCGKCGYISFWEITNEDINAFLEEDMYNEGYGIVMAYSKNEIEAYKRGTENKMYKENAERLLGMFEKQKK